MCHKSLLLLICLLGFVVSQCSKSQLVVERSRVRQTGSFRVIPTGSVVDYDGSNTYFVTSNNEITHIEKTQYVHLPDLIFSKVDQ
jgi:hypothetical protein